MAHIAVLVEVGRVNVCSASQFSVVGPLTFPSETPRVGRVGNDNNNKHDGVLLTLPVTETPLGSARRSSRAGRVFLEEGGVRPLGPTSECGPERHAWGWY